MTWQMEGRIADFCQELRLIEANSAVLSAASVYCLGQCIAKRGDFSLADILDLVKRLAERAASGHISEGLRTIAEFYISEGNIEKARSLLQDKSDSLLKRHRDTVPISTESLKRLRLEDLHSTFTNKEEKSPPTVAIMCSICLEIIPEADFLPLEKCGCLFHQNCVFAHLSTAIKEQKYPLVCPQAKCRAEIHPMDLKERLSAPLYKQLEQSQMEAFIQRNGRDFKHCPTPDCPYVFAWTQENPRFKCPVCLKVWCLLCRKEFHEGISCKEYEQLTDPKALDVQFDATAYHAGFQLCPSCNAWVEKVDGCNMVLCLCETTFCYYCGVVDEECKCGGEEQAEELTLCPTCQQQVCVCPLPLCPVCFQSLDQCDC